MRVDGDIGDLSPDSASGVVVHTDMRRTGWFSCSDERVNRFHAAAVWSLRDNACDIPTDCPTRERAGWTGDWQLFVPAAAFVGGLAATALVFAMFQLNPAPFCLLDEVDAPLDDANTERFANLVRAMSAKTQFLHLAQQDCDGNGAATDRRDHAGAGRVADRRGRYGNGCGVRTEYRLTRRMKRADGARLHATQRRLAARDRHDRLHR